ncbi:MAG: Unknown protein [uncultured Sulfurovum sp.]|uniref:Plasminogen-binding protein PgbA N-terminal domain-containing protein n=1 Tax=uncultured Sulfurovum sp. TaxID=269237 RepID=A0A6S6SVF8_9BACT|nr:MAG: Unknown protein [uncultured Sulfurovum sp.]
MRKILFFILLTSYALFADFLPNSMKTSVEKISKNTIELGSNIPAGMSGIIIHNYGNGLSAITHSSISLGNGKASIEPYTAIVHKNIPDIQTALSVGDQAVFGNFYDNALVIAPNQTAYQQITSKFKRTWIHPDAFALAFMQTEESHISMDSLAPFAKQNQIGLVLLVTENKLLVIDPISKKVIKSTGLKTNPNSAMTPFYARFDQINLSLFNFSDRVYTPYFQSVAGIQ